MSKLIQSKFYARMITVSDYVLLGILWILTSLLLVTLFSTTSATIYVLEKWRVGDSGHILQFFFEGLKRHIILSLVLSIVIIGYVYVVGSCIHVLETTHTTPIYLVLSLLSSVLFYSLVIGLIRHADETVSVMFSKAYRDLFNHLMSNIMIIVLSYIFYVVVSIFPPIVFLLGGLYLKLIDLLLQAKY